MQDITRDLFVSLAAFASIFGIIYVFLMTRHRERIAMLEKGVDLSFFAPKGTSSHTLKFGMLSVGIAVGILMGNYLHRADVMSKAPAFLSMIFLFGGVSLILNFLIERKLKS
jgi:hypothetical protein